MKFGDKLIALRKKNGLSQEELAEKLGVSRQSVSKWESNNTYPETDKIVQICNLFGCSMDDLINDKITDIDQVIRKEKSASTINIDSLLEFITKTIDMFAGMTFGSGFKCVIELGLIALALTFGGMVVISITTGLLESLLSFMNNSYLVTRFISSILEIIWFVLSLICLVHIFKIRYLDYYEKAICDNDSLDRKKQNNKKSEFKENRKEKMQHQEKVENLVIRDVGEKPFAFLSVLSKMVIYFIKFCALMFIIAILMMLFALVACFVVLLPFCFNSLIFFGINVAILAGIVVSLLLAILLFYFVANKKVNAKLAIVAFVSSIIVGAIGSGVGVLGLKDVEVKDISSSDNLSKYEEKIYYTGNLYIDHFGYDVDYIVDDEMITDEILVSTNYDSRFFKVSSYYDTEDEMKGYSLHTNSNMNFKRFYDMFLKNLKNNIIINYENSELDTIVVKANKVTIDKLMSNLSKMYLYEETNISNGIRTSEYEYKVEVDDYDCSGRYDALNDKMKIDSRYCKCERRTIDTYKGTKIIYKCNSIDNDEDDYYDE